MDIHEAAQKLSVAAHEVLDIRHHAGWWEALHHDMASHAETWRPVAPAPADAPAAEAAPPTEAAPPAPVDDDPEGPGVDTDGDGIPEGNAKQVLDWVGEDRDRAAAALARENAQDKPRSTLVAALEKLVPAE